MSPSSYPRCIFCDRTDSPPHKEDILAKWIAREFVRAGAAMFRMQIGRLDETPTLVFQKRNQLGVVSRGPCQRCNNEWMSELEGAAKPILVPLMRGERRDLTEEDRRVITRWVTKVAMLVESDWHPSGRVFEAPDRHALSAASTIPGGTHVWGGRYIGPVLKARMISGGFQAPISAPEGRPEAYCFTVTIMQLTLQLVSVGLPTHHRRRVGMSVPDDLADVLLAFWPLSGAAVTWPPKRAISPEGLHFLERWHFNP